MTDDERKLAVALAGVTFVPGIPTKRFARNLAGWATDRHLAEKDLTRKQRKYLCESVVRFRRQIPADVVAIARTLLA